MVCHVKSDTGKYFEVKLFASVYTNLHIPRDWRFGASSSHRHFDLDHHFNSIELDGLAYLSHTTYSFVFSNVADLFK